MATMVLQAAGGLVGGMIGGPFGAVLGRAAGGLAGASLDASLFGETRKVEGARLDAVRIMEADEGAGIARVYGTARVAGQVIWATRFEEESETERQGGKGGGPAVEATSYRYFGNFAVGLCEGPVAGIRRVWADGEELDLEETPLRVYRGDEEQAPDPVIEVKQRSGAAAGGPPAYRGLAYLVFERLSLERFGNRLPQISAEVIRPVGALEEKIRALTVIPGATEHGYDPETVRERLGPGEDRLVNRTMLFGASDWTASMDEAARLCPKLGRAALVVAWFGDDLRAGRCSLRPGVEVRERDESETWHAGGAGRDGARLVSRVDGGPAFGGTPSDAGYVRAVADLHARGLKVTHYPFILMDVPAGNRLPDPHGGGGEQPAYPWRGRMTLDAAPGHAGSPDGTAQARAQIEAFLGGAQPGDFDTRFGRVTYRGPAEWSYRRMILHQAHLAAAAGVDAFVIGSEMRGLTRIRDEKGRFPFVEGLVRLARDVKAILPGAVVTYAADWSEYFGYQPADGSGDVFYNLDALWACEAIDAVGIDNYLPLADWRDDDIDDPVGEAPSAYDRDALQADIAGGEGFDFYYADEADRIAGRRTPITDGAHGKPWVFRPKDLVAWWSNRHVERRGGAEVGPASEWVPKSKPIWFTELGCPAIDKGANQPNLFVDPKSAESLTPHFSAGGRDDLVQRRFLEAHLDHWDPAAPGFDEARNPWSDTYGGRMVAHDAIHLWTWDARPYPAFPERGDVWSDGGNWRRGHWLTGRLGTAPLDALIAAIGTDHGVGPVDARHAEAVVTGFVSSGPASARALLEDLMRMTGTIGHASEGSSGHRLVFRALSRRVEPVAIGALVDVDGPRIEAKRAEAGERPEEISLAYLDPARAYQPATAEAVRAGASPAPRTQILRAPVVVPEEIARGFATRALEAAAGDDETLRFSLSPRFVGLEAGDVVTLPDRACRWLVDGLGRADALEVEARRLPVPVGGNAGDGSPASPVGPTRPVAVSRPVLVLLDLPLPEGGAAFEGARYAVHARPFAGYHLGLDAGRGFARRASATARATVGHLETPLAHGPVGLIDSGNRPRVRLYAGSLAAIDRPALLAGGNLAAVRAANGEWEVIQFAAAEEVGAGLFEIGDLLRGQGGTDDATLAGAPVGAAFVLLDRGCGALGLAAGEAGHAVSVRAVPFGRPPDDPAVVTQTAALGLRCVRPLSPVHLTARRTGDGGLSARWIRRTRIDGDRWEGREVALGEERERYLVCVRPAGDAVGSGVETPSLVQEVETPNLDLRAQDLEAVFGPPDGGDLALSVAQISPVHGAGFERRTLVRR